MMKGFFVFYFILTGLSFSAQAKMLELKKSTRSIFIEEKNGWILGKNLFGMPFIYFSPQTNGQRSNISFTDTGADLELDIKSLATTQEKYQKNRKAWAETIGANALGFSAYEVSINKNGHKIHKIGFSYEHEGKSYNEKSFYIECRGKILFSKSLRLLSNDKHEKDFNDLVGGLDCGGV
jgi:hypothetical protein